MSNSRSAIKVTQNFGVFYITKFKASELIKLSFSDSYRMENDEIKGNQRKLNNVRLAEIKEYIKSVDCALPNSVILAANITGEGLICDDYDIRWEIDDEEKEAPDLRIPTDRKLAAIIDGQHRINGFAKLSKDELQKHDVEIPCSVYIDLPTSLQAYLFATINSTQKSVSKTLAYDLFSYELEATNPDTWSPDKLAISIAKKLNDDSNSPLFKRINSTLISNDSDWTYTLPSIVDSVIRLISTNPKLDKNILHQQERRARNRSSINNSRHDRSPLRALYVSCRDEVIYKVISNFLQATFTTLQSFTDNDQNSILTKNVGILGLFDSMRSQLCNELASGKSLNDIDMTVSGFSDFLNNSAHVNFGSPCYKNATTGVGRQKVRATINLAYNPELEPRIKIPLKEEILKEIAQ